jgi:squalene-associated FAD-dependent desaturase
MGNPVVHVIGAGLAGLAAAVRLTQAGAKVAVHEAAGQAGGRCRSYHDPAVGMMIDNGNHLILSGNHATLDYLRTIGAEHLLIGPAAAEFPFVDLASKERWTLRPNAGRLPWWIFSANRRIPGTCAIDYLGIVRLIAASSAAPIGAVMNCSGTLYDRLWRPFLLAALNTEPREAAAGLAAAVIRATLLKGGRACRPLIARDGLSGALVDPALRFLAARGAAIHFGHRLRALAFEGRRAEALDFGDEAIELAPADAVVLAVPPPVAAALVPGLATPTEFRSILNAHFRLTPPAKLAPITGVLNGTVEWIFSFPERISITVSGADRLLEVPRETLARDLWREVAAVTGIAEALPPWQIVRERRATFAALPAENAKRPAAVTAWENLVLAGDWTATGLPATIEGAIRSGDRAAMLVSGRG